MKRTNKMQEHWEVTATGGDTTNGGAYQDVTFTKVRLPVSLMFIHASLPHRESRCIKMCHELPAADAPDEHQQMTREWIELALELGAVGFWREEVSV